MSFKQAIQLVEIEIYLALSLSLSGFEMLH